MTEGNPYGDEEFTEVDRSEAALAQLGILADKQLAAEQEVEAAEAALKVKKDDLYKVETEELPNAMKAVGMEEFVTTSGLKITIKEKMEAALTGKYKIPAFDFLKETENESLIQREVKALFAKNEGAKADLIIKAIQDAGWTCSDSSAINTTSFKALVAEMLKNGEKVELDKIGIHLRTVAKVVRKK